MRTGPHVNLGALGGFFSPCMHPGPPTPHSALLTSIPLCGTYLNHQDALQGGPDTPLGQLGLCGGDVVWVLMNGAPSNGAPAAPAAPPATPAAPAAASSLQITHQGAGEPDSKKAKAAASPAAAPMEVDPSTAPAASTAALGPSAGPLSAAVAAAAAQGQGLGASGGDQEMGPGHAVQGHAGGHAHEGEGEEEEEEAPAENVEAPELINGTEGVSGRRRRASGLIVHQVPVRC